LFLDILRFVIAFYVSVSNIESGVIAFRGVRINFGRKGIINPKLIILFVTEIEQKQ